MHLFNEEFWLAISFLIFVYLIYQPVKSIILKSLDEKILIIKQQVLESEKLNEDMELLFKNSLNQIQKIETLREEMLKKSIESTNALIEVRNKEIEKFLENKKLSALDLINMKNSQALQLLEVEFGNKIIELVTLYLQSTKNEGMLDIEITKNLMVRQGKRISSNW